MSHGQGPFHGGGGRQAADLTDGSTDFKKNG